MEISKSIFREYDIRGIYPEQINEQVVQKIAKAISVKCLNEGVSEICIARDGRLSGEKLLSALANSLSDNGIDVINTGMATTPLLYFAAKKSASKSGVMITGSHNPKSYNGIKLIINDNPVSGNEIYNLLNKTDEVSKRKGKITFKNFKDEYISEIKKNIVLKDKLKVVIDCGNGASGCVAPRLYSELGCDVVNLYTEIDGNFPNHHPDPGKPENLIDLIKKVKETHADLGLAFDGDGDRVGLVTADGVIVFPDKILMMLCKDILSSNKGKIIYDVKCTDSLPRLIKDYGGTPLMYPTGHFNIKNGIKEHITKFLGYSMKYKPYYLKDVYTASAQNKFNVISTFAGGGGSSTGYRLAGGKILCINEFVEEARNTYHENYPNTPILQDDIKEL